MKLKEENHLMCRKYLMTLKQERTINNKGKRKKKRCKVYL